MKHLIPLLIPKGRCYQLIIAYLLMVVCSYNALASTDSQFKTDMSKVKVSFDVKQTSIDKVFEKIGTQTEFSFFYEQNLVKEVLPITLSVKNETLESVLYLLAESYQLQFKQVNDRISVKRSLQPKVEQHINVALTVKGTVRDEDNEPIPGVSILIKGTSSGTVTDLDGNYFIENVPDDGILVYSFIGYMKQEIPVDGRTELDVTLSLDTQSLDEVVVIGYGTVEKRDLTGAVASVDVKQQEELPNVNLFQSLQGRVPGLNVGATTSSGANPRIDIRGQNTLSSSAGDNAPLIVLDGIIYRGSMVDINPASVESVEVLKDGSAAAVYGSQASNGVILVTTKKGKQEGKPIINYSGQFSLQVPSKTLEPFNTAESKAFLDDVYWTDSRIGPEYLTPNQDFSVVPFLKTLQISEGYENNLDNDWWGMLTGDGHINKHDISIRGRSENSGYFVSAGILDQKGFIKNDDYQRISLNINMDTKITDWLKFGMETFLTSSDYSGVSPGVGAVFHLQTFAPLYDDNGDYVLEPNGTGLNPFLQYQIDDEEKRLNLFGNFHFDVQLPFLDGFNYRLNFGNNYINNIHNQFNPWGANYTGSGYKNRNERYSYIFDNIISYKRSFNDSHKLNVTLLYGVENIQTNYTNSSAQNFVNPTLGYNKLDAGDPTLNSLSSGAEKETSLYTMGRAIYTFNDRYMLTATVRRDGFSGFGSNSKFGIFPSIAAGWVMSEESFMEYSGIDYLKFRVSYGQTGRRGLSRYQTLARMGSTQSIVFGDGGSATIGQWISSMANDNLKWETTTGLNIGFDFELLKSRLYGNIEYYRNNTENILYDIQIPIITGFSSISTNIGNVKNHGLELALNGRIIQNSDMSLETGFNISRNRNEIVSILGADNNGDGKEDDIVSNQLFIGEPQNVVFDYEVIGMWQLEDEVPDGFFSGTYKLDDANGDGTITPDDRKILGYRDPSYRFGISNTFRYKNFSVYVFINSIQGGKDYYYADGSPYQDGALFKKDQLSYSNAMAFDYWMPENPNAKYRRLDTPSSFDGRPYDQRNFVRLQDVSIAYNFNSEFLERLHIRNLKVNLSGKNLATWTKWEGWDPETGVGLVAGVPLMRNYTLGLNIEF
ncbi:TonB-dependent receptor [Echinicola sp. CAU 1574]|uniref:TonB-dependent receptor n=1 Tax=Echinicola arenosa TaxID=2774144 RepID=A0ABR9AJV2_9BACT|nr:TonB-dependent receptor [Echinicola arenosa]MBD8489102.1 TonB-dependent receptor [Echinicola arenosa]